MQNYITVWISSQVRRACATVQAFAVLAALPLSAAELTHRWSFNGDWSDSAGGADAVKCGIALRRERSDEADGGSRLARRGARRQEKRSIKQLQ